MLLQVSETTLYNHFEISDYTYQHQTVFFDIETTGFSSTSFIYLIGCGYYEDHRFKIQQWFAKDESEEKNILRAFLKFLRPYFIGVTYNGLGFDIPFLKKRCHFHQLHCTFEKLQMMDIYKKISPYRHFFHLPSLKQSDVEEFLEIPRKDCYSGKELISVYRDYQKSPSKKTLDLLLLHNFEDVSNMISILPILSYEKIFQGQWTLHSLAIDSFTDREGNLCQEGIFTLHLLTPLPKRISHSYEKFYLTGYESTIKLRIPLHTGELKYYISDYKNYYYLPGEDTAIHKSVAFYVDKDYRTQAKAATCYSKKTGRFLPQKKIIVNPYFKIDYYDKETYFECSDSFLENTDLVYKYIRHILNLLPKQKER